jgi:type IV pilus assembly protein PilV
MSVCNSFCRPHNGGAGSQGRASKLRLKRISGFTLLEALITIIVVAIGLLGVAGLQVAAIKLGDVANSRSEGIQYATDIAERMRANRPLALNGQLSAYNVGFGSTPNGTDLASTDIIAWKAALARLAQGDGRIVVEPDTVPPCNSVPGKPDCALVTITVRWSEERALGSRATTANTFTLTTRM